MNGGGLKTMYEIEEISWKEIKKVWEQHLCYLINMVKL